MKVDHFAFLHVFFPEPIAEELLAGSPSMVETHCINGGTCRTRDTRVIATVLRNEQSLIEE